jgi:Phytanoyl-CoA dioxygenase (PhyH).
MSNSAQSVSFAPQVATRQSSLPNVEQLKAAFAKDGYLVFRNLVSPERLSALHKQLSQSFDDARRSGQLFSGGGTISGHLNCFPGESSRFAYEALESNGIVDLIKSLFPKATRLPNVGCNFNLPHSVAQHYHADRNYPRPLHDRQRGRRRYEHRQRRHRHHSGSHQKFYKYWRFAMERVARGSTRIEMKQGDVLVRTSNVWHRGMPNTTDAPRPMVAFTWEDGGSNQPDPFKAEGGKIAFRQNWYRPTALGRLRERTFVSAPVTYSAYRFVTSLYGTKGYDHQ